jgi:hypothetical protein
LLGPIARIGLADYYLAMPYAIDDNGSALSVQWAGKPVFDYCYLPKTPVFESPKPYFQLYSPAAETLTLFRPHDHPWHHGLAFTLTQLSGNNFWGGATYLRGEGYQDVDNQGRQLHRGWISAPKGGESLEIAQHLDWLSFGGEALLKEERRISASKPLSEDGWLLNFETELKNVCGRDLEVGSPTTAGREMAGYMGLMWRGPRSFLHGKIISPDGPEEKEPMGKRCPWLAFQGGHDSTLRRSTFAFADHPANPRYPNNWFVRNDPFAIMACAFAFFEILPFPAGSALKLRYKILAADGEWEPKRLAQVLEEK